MLSEGIRADLLHAKAFEAHNSHAVAGLMDEWLQSQQGTIIHDIIPISSEQAAIIVIFRITRV